MCSWAGYETSHHAQIGQAAYILVPSELSSLPPILGDLAVSDQTKEHLQELCQKCIELGHYCRKAKKK